MDRRKRIIVNIHEEATRIILEKTAIKFDVRVFAKIRLADALNIERSGLSDQEYRFALQCHLDFVVSDSDSKALFAVEFDEPYHDTDKIQRHRDNMKDSICERLGLPLLRINADFLTQQFGQFSLLSWLFETWFSYQAFHEAQEDGLIPLDECFDYTPIVLTVDSTGKTTWCPLDPFTNARYYVRDAVIEKKLFSVEEYEVDDSNGYIVGLGIGRVNHEEYIIGEAKCRKFNFPSILSSDLCAELLVVDLASKINQHLQEKYRLRTGEEVRDKLHHMEELAKRTGQAIPLFPRSSMSNS